MLVLNSRFGTSILSKLRTNNLSKLNLLKNSLKSYIRPPTAFKVTVCGAVGHVGQPLCLMLKQCPLINELAVYDIADTCNLAVELGHIDTSCKVTSYSGIGRIGEALEGSKVVAVVAAARTPVSASYDALFHSNAPIIQEIITNCSSYCPNALIAIATNPVNCLVPLAYEILKSNGVHSDKTVFGVTTLNGVRANTFVADVQGLEPECVFVPVIGGNADKTIVPVLSQAKPCADFTDKELEKITNNIQNAHNDVLTVKKTSSSTLACGFAVARFVISLVKGIRQYCDIVECAYVRSKVCPDVKYLATPVRIGPRGIQRNMGLPSLTEYEKCLLENAIPYMLRDIKKAEQFAIDIKSTGDVLTNANLPAASVSK